MALGQGRAHSTPRLAPPPELMVFLLFGTLMMPLQFCLQETTPDYISPALTPFSSEHP